MRVVGKTFTGVIILKKDNRKVALIGTGLVGMSFAFAIINQNLCDELVLIDIDAQRAEGEAMDLNHGMAFAQSRIKIYAGVYGDCSDADIAVITAGANQRPGETRLELLNKNAAIISQVVASVLESGFSGLFLVATNPVDIMTRLVKELSGFDGAHVIGSGTTLDTARLRYLIGDYFSIDPRNVHAYVIGEHGDSEFVAWSQALVSTVPVTEMCIRSRLCALNDLQEIEDDVRNAAYVIIKAKKATYYGVGMALARIVKAIFADESSILTVSACMKGEYGLNGVYIGVPSVVGRDGIKRVLPLSLTTDELAKLTESGRILEENYRSIEAVKPIMA